VRRLMKLEAEIATTEQQLAEALEASGRPISLLQLKDWRKEGLLPPLACHGLGTGKGKIYYWNEVNIVAHAQCVYDLLARHSRYSVSLLILWICGYPVPHARVRRAWLQRFRKPKTWQLRNVFTAHQKTLQLGTLPSTQETADVALLHVVLTLCGSLSASHRSEAEEFYQVLRNTSEAFGYTITPGNEVEHRLFTALSLTLSAVESSSLISVASEEDMNAACDFTAEIISTIQRLTSDKTESNHPTALMDLAEKLGPSLFLCALLLQRTGYQEHLAQSSAAAKKLSAETISGISNRKQAIKTFKSHIERIWRTAPKAYNFEIPKSRTTGLSGTLND